MLVPWEIRIPLVLTPGFPSKGARRPMGSGAGRLAPRTGSGRNLGTLRGYPTSYLICHLSVPSYL